MNRHIRYDVSKFSDCVDHEGKKIACFTVRTTDGKDETQASKQAEARGSTMIEELIRTSLESYDVTDISEDGKSTTRTVDIKHPFVQFDEWSTKIRNFVVAAWRRLSTPDEQEIKDFFASASEIE